MPAATIDIRELQSRFDEVIALVAEGGEVVVTESAVPRARIVALAEQRPRQPDLHPGAFTMAADFNDPLPDEFWTGEA